jgi:hypothetical protein
LIRRSLCRSFTHQSTPQDRLNILYEQASVFKGTIYERYVYDGTILPKDFVFMLWICFSFKKRQFCGGGGGHTVESATSKKLGELKITRLWVMNQELLGDEF